MTYTQRPRRRLLLESTYKVLWNDEYLKSFTHKLIQSDVSTSAEDTLVFWYEDEKTGEIKINRHILMTYFFPALGVRNLMLGKDKNGLDTPLPVFVNGNRLEEITPEVLKSITYKVIDFFGKLTGDKDTANQVRTALTFTNQIFEKNGLRGITDLYEKSPVSDTASSAIRFFKNGWVEIAKDGVSALRDYSELPEDKIIWNDCVIDRDYLFANDVTASLENLRINRIHPETGEYVNKKPELTALIKEWEAKVEEQKNTPRDTHYRDFVTNLAMTGEGAICPVTLERLKLGIGYLCHRHHFADKRKWVEIVDRDFDVSRKRADGGNGKSVLIKSLANIMNVAFLDGKEFKKGRSDTFAFANVTPSTELCFFDDADEKFDTTRLFSRTTGDFYVRRMRQNPFSIKASNAPKIVITSNYPLGDSDNSTRRRQFVIEVGSFYKDLAEYTGETPADYHGGKQIAEEDGGWNEVDWSEFYRFVFECIALYLEKGLPARDDTTDNFKRSQLIAGFACDDAEALCDFYVDYLNALAKSGEQVFAHAFYKSVRSTFPNLPKEWNDERLYRQLRDVGVAFKVYPNKWMNGNLQQVRLGEDTGMWQKWIDAGLEGTLKSTGEEFAPGDRARAFSVTRLSSPNPSTFSPDFTNKPSQDVLEGADASSVIEEVA